MSPANNFSFPPRSRLHESREYRAFLGRAEKARLGPALVLRIPNQKDHSRLGITVRGKVNSVERNLLKRTIREAFRVRKDSLGSFDFNVIVTVKDQIPFRLAHELREALQTSEFATRRFRS